MMAANQFIPDEIQRIFNSGPVNSLQLGELQGRYPNVNVREAYCRNLGLIEEQYELFDSQIYERARAMLNARAGIHINNIGGGIGVHKYTYALHHHMAQGQVAMDFKKELDMVDYTEVTDVVPIIQSPVYYIPGRLLQASRNKPTPVDIENMADYSSTYRVAELEDQFILQGWSMDGGTTFDWPGLYQGAGLSVADALPWSTPANIQTSIIKTKNTLKAAHIPGPYNLFLNPTNYTEAEAIITNTSDAWIPWLKERLEGGTIIQTEGIDEGTGLMTASKDWRTPTGGRGFEMMSFLDVTHEIWKEPGDHGLYGRGYEVALVVIREPNTLCKMEHI